MLPENFFEGGSNFIEDGSFGQFILNLHRHLTENDFSLKGGGGRGRVHHMKPLWNRQWGVTLKSTARE